MLSFYLCSYILGIKRCFVKYIFSRKCSAFLHLSRWTLYTLWITCQLWQVSASTMPWPYVFAWFWCLQPLHPQTYTYTWFKIRFHNGSIYIHTHNKIILQLTYINNHNISTCCPSRIILILGWRWLYTLAKLYVVLHDGRIGDTFFQPVPVSTCRRTSITQEWGNSPKRRSKPASHTYLFRKFQL